MTNATDAMTSQYMADVVQAAIECLCANGFQSRTHRLTEVRDRLRASPITINHDGIDRKLIDDASPAGSASGEDAWIPVSERLPKPLKPVLLAIRDGGRAHVLRACYAAPNTLELGWESECWEGCTEDEETGATYCPEGWYEWNRHEETHWHVTEEIIGWQPLPAIQGSANGQG